MGLKGWPYLARDQAKDIDSAGNLSQQCDPGHGRSQGLILLLRLWNTHKKGPIMAAFQKTQEAAKSVKWRYLHLTNGRKLLAYVVELWKGWMKLRSRAIL